MNLDIYIYFCMIQMTRYRRISLGGDSLAQISINVEAQLVGTPSTIGGEIFKFHYLIS